MNDVLCGECRCPAPCLAHPELTAADAPPLNGLAPDATPKKWDDLSLAEQAHRMAEALWAEVQSQPPRGSDPPTITIGYLFASNICGVLHKCTAAALRATTIAADELLEATMVAGYTTYRRLSCKRCDEAALSTPSPTIAAPSPSQADDAALNDPCIEEIEAVAAALEKREP